MWDKFKLLILIFILSVVNLNAKNNFDYKNLNAVKIGNNWGYMDWQGELIIPPLFEEAKDFTEGLGQVKIGDFWGFINEKKNFVVAPIYDQISSFSEGFAAVKIDGKWGYISKAEECRIEPIF